MSAESAVANPKMLFTGYGYTPILTNQEIDEAPIESLRKAAVSYAQIFYQGYTIEYAQALGLKEAFPEELRLNFLKHYETLSEQETRAQFKAFFAPGGVEKVNGKLYDQLDFLVQQWEQVKFQKKLIRPRPDLAANAVRARAANYNSTTVQQIVKETAPETPPPPKSKLPYLILGFFALASLIFFLKF